MFKAIFSSCLSEAPARTGNFYCCSVIMISSFALQPVCMSECKASCLYDVGRALRRQDKICVGTCTSGSSWAQSWAMMTNW